MGEVLFLALVLLLWAKSTWAAVVLAVMMVLGAVHSVMGWKMYVLGRAGPQDGRNHPFRTARAYGLWSREQGRRPAWLWAAVVLWVTVPFALVATFATR